MATYTPTWESLEEHSIPRWFHDAPFGVYFHWGPYAVPAYENEWYSRNMYQEGLDQHEHHVETYGEPGEFGYKDFLPAWDADDWDPHRWVRECKQAGAEFVGITAMHADGYALWDAEGTRWNSVETGPGIDILGELAAAVRAHDLKFLASVHHDFHWWWYQHRDEWDTGDPEYTDLYGVIHNHETPPPERYFEWWADLTREVIEGYRPDLLYFDSGLGNDWFVRHDEYTRELIADYYNAAERWGKDVEFTAKQNVPPGVGIVDHERTRLDDVSARPWLTDTSVDIKSWGYVEDPEYKDATTLVTGLVDRISKHGRLLLNIGPKPDGTLDDGALELLHGVGDWLEVNEEAVAGARPWWTYGEGPTEVSGAERESASQVEYTAEDIRFTRVGQTIYAIVMGWPDDGTVRIETPVGRRFSIDAGGWPIGPEPDNWPADDYAMRLLGSNDTLDWRRVDGGDAMEITLPEERPCDHAYTIAIEIDRVNQSE